MDEETQKTPEGEATKTSTETPEEEDLSPLEQVRQFNEENKKLLVQITEERKKIEKASAEVLIGGRSKAGQSQPVKSREEQIKEGAKEFWKGSEIEKAIERHG